MKVAVPRKNVNRRSFQPAPIPLERPESKSVDKDKLVVNKCRVDPNNNNSAPYEISIKPFDGAGSVEEYFIFLKQTYKVVKGQGLSTGPQGYALYRRLFTGTALARFETAAAAAGNETVEHLKTTIQSVTNYVLPKKALQTQRRYMRRLVRKPKELPMKAYVNRFHELNDYLAMFDTDVGDANKLDEDEIKEHIEFAIPGKWRQQMILQGVEPLDETIDNIIDFCERQEFSEDIFESTHAIATKSDDAKPRNGKRGSKMMTSKAAKERNSNNPKYFCHYHGPNYSHDTNKCKVVIAQAEKMASAHSNLQNGNKKAKYGNKTWDRPKNNNNNDELNVMIQKAVKAAVSENESAKKRKATDPPGGKDNFAAEEQFEALSLSDSDSDN